MTEPPLLSICIPTYNRREAVVALARSILAVDGPIELRVHVDGSTDGSLEALQGIDDPRLVVSSDVNMGRANAIERLVGGARGTFLMIYDDDDTITRGGLERILADCRSGASPGSCGFIYHMDRPEGGRLGTAFGVERANLISLRADHRVVGDKKEVVLTEIIRSALLEVKGRYRRVPTSLGWSRIALEHDIECREVSVGTKDYLAGGMSAGIRKLKAADPYPVFLVHKTRLRAFRKGRYRSWRYAGRSLVATLRFGLMVLNRSLPGRRLSR